MPEGKRPHPRFSLARHCLENAVDNCPVRHHVIVVILPRAGSRGAQEQVVFLHRSMSRIIVTSPCPNLLPPLARSGSSSSANPATAPKKKCRAVVGGGRRVQKGAKTGSLMQSTSSKLLPSGRSLYASNTFLLKCSAPSATPKAQSGQSEANEPWPTVTCTRWSPEGSSQIARPT